MNKFADWLNAQDKKQRLVAAKLGISTSTLHNILRLDMIPSLKVAIAIEKYTNGDVTVYDWFDAKTKIPSKTRTKKNSQRNRCNSLSSRKPAQISESTAFI